MAQRDGAAVGVDAGVVVGQTEAARDGQALRGEGLVEFDHVDLRQLQATMPLTPAVIEDCRAGERW
jgi:hypothetical protein